MAKQKFNNSVIRSVIDKNKSKREVIQLSIKIDSKLDRALIKLSSALNISKNKLIEETLLASGIIREVEENYHD